MLYTEWLMGAFDDNALASEIFGMKVGAHPGFRTHRLCRPSLPHDER
jgi:hypothetical protein